MSARGAAGSRWRFGPALAAIAAVGLVIRVAAMLRWYRALPLGFSDNFFYSQQANLLADGHGFADPFHWSDTGGAEIIASADHPPLYSLYLAVWSLLGFTGSTHHRLASNLLGVGTVVLVGLVARHLRGDRAGLIAAAVAAAYPPLWIADGMIVAESPYALLIALVALLALRLVEVPSLPRAAALGAGIGLCALTRSEGVGLLVLLVVPLVLALPLAWRHRVEIVAVAVAVAVALVMPWSLRNARHFAEPVPLAYGAGFVLKVGNCDSTYHGRLLGYWDVACIYDGPMLPDKSVAEKEARAQAMTYIRDNLDRVPVVVAARVGRLWHAYRVGQGIDFDVFFERRGRGPSVAGVGALYGAVALGAVGAWSLRRRVAQLVPFAALIASATLSAAVAFGITRYRIAGDVALVVLAGVGVDWLLRRRSGARPGEST